MSNSSLLHHTRDSLKTVDWLCKPTSSAVASAKAVLPHYNSTAL